MEAKLAYIYRNPGNSMATRKSFQSSSDGYRKPRVISLKAVAKAYYSRLCSSRISCLHPFGYRLQLRGRMVPFAKLRLALANGQFSVSCISTYAVIRIARPPVARERRGSGVRWSGA